MFYLFWNKSECVVLLLLLLECCTKKKSAAESFKDISEYVSSV